MSLRAICQSALREIGGFEVPASFFGNGNITARQCLALVLRDGNTLERENRFASLITTYTFTTVTDTASYALPDDFRAFAHMTQWDRTNQLPMNGPAPAHVWQFLKSGIAQGATISRWFRVQGNSLYIHPTPTSEDTIAFDYYSKNWITKQSDSEQVREFYSDNDTCLIDEDLLTLGLKWRFLQAKGMPFEAEYREYESVRDSVMADDGGKGRINLGRPRPVFDQIPDTGFGS